MFIKRLKPNVYDVFVGRGWNQWARVTRRGHDIQQVGGSWELDRRSLSVVKERIIK